MTHVLSYSSIFLYSRGSDDSAHLMTPMHSKRPNHTRCEKSRSDPNQTLALRSEQTLKFQRAIHTGPPEKILISGFWQGFTVFKNTPILLRIIIYPSVFFWPSSFLVFGKKKKVGNPWSQMNPCFHVFPHKNHIIVGKVKDSKERINKVHQYQLQMDQPMT